MKKLPWILVLLFILPIVYAGVTSPLPSNIELTKGDSGRFKFQVQAVNMQDDIVCTYSFADQPPFAVEFDTEEVVVQAGSREDVYGTVSVPEDASLGTSTAEFCVSCRPVNAPAGASVNIDTCGLELKTTVVESRTRDNLYVPKKPEPKPFPVVPVLVVAGLVVIAFIAFYLFYLGRKRRKVVKPAPVKHKVSKRK